MSVAGHAKASSGVDQRAVVLVSGGIDSAVTLGEARAAGLGCYAVTFDYGQRHRAEIESAARVARAGGAERHLILPLDLRAIGGSALTDELAVPKDRPQETAEIPVTYVPARNLIFLSLALAWAEVLGAREIFVGVNAVDYSGYPDCREPFIRAFERTATLATRAGVEGATFQVRTPLIGLSKAQIILRAAALGIDLSQTLSCYDPDELGRACGHCDSCLIRARGFREAGSFDSTRYSPTAAGVRA